jgi:hypothetical protein
MKKGNHMKKFLMLATAAFALTAAIPAIAADATAETPAATAEAPAEAPKDAPKGPGPTKARGMFDRGDVNKDGVVTKEEFLAQSEEAFKQLDTDGDGKITKAEVEAKRQKWVEMREKRKKQTAEQGQSKPPAAEGTSE